MRVGRPLKWKTRFAIYSVGPRARGETVVAGDVRHQRERRPSWSRAGEGRNHLQLVGVSGLGDAAALVNVAKATVPAHVEDVTFAGPQPYSDWGRLRSMRACSSCSMVGRAWPCFARCSMYPRAHRTE